jgi:hypothetical protein
MICMADDVRYALVIIRLETSTFVIDLAQRVWPDFAQLYLIGLLACIVCKSLMQSRSSSLRSLLPFCYPTAQYGAGQGSTWQRPCSKMNNLLRRVSTV